jgi:hypothetical protein
MKVRLDQHPNYWENIKCSKPPTRLPYMASRMRPVQHIEMPHISPVAGCQHTASLVVTEPIKRTNKCVETEVRVTLMQPCKTEQPQTHQEKQNQGKFIYSTA